MRIRPVGDGHNEDKIRRFFCEELGIDNQTIDTLGPLSTMRVPYGPKSKITKEMIVKFATTEGRDLVKGSARNLASKGSTYGVRLELPNHLKTNMGALQSLSYKIRQKHADAKRNILFNDEHRTLSSIFLMGKVGHGRESPPNKPGPRLPR